MVNRKSAGICALLVSWRPTVFSQEIPILPAPASIAGPATTEPVASSQDKPASTAGVLRFAPVPAARVPLTVDAEGRSFSLRTLPNGKPFGVRVNAHFGEARLLIAPTL